MPAPDFLNTKKSKDMHIDELAKEAKEKGMSYGQLKAERFKQEMPKIDVNIVKPVEKAKPKTTKNKKNCEKEQENIWHRRIIHARTLYVG